MKVNKSTLRYYSSTVRFGITKFFGPFIQSCSHTLHALIYCLLRVSSDNEYSAKKNPDKLIQAYRLPITDYQ